MSLQNVWEQYFDGQAPSYLENAFTRNTIAEVDFLVKDLGLSAEMSVLDVGCGTGRHAIEMARRGFRVTGVDISRGMFDVAGALAAEAGVEVRLVQSDVAERLPDGPFDAAICLCEGGFGLLGQSDDPYHHELSILRNVDNALNPGSMFVLTVANAMAAVRRVTQRDVQAGSFDTETLVEEYELQYDTPEGRSTVVLREKVFTPSELVLLLYGAGFTVEHVWGGTAGSWGRRKVELDEMEIMAVCFSNERH